MHGIAQFVLCDFSQQHFFFIFDFYLKKKLFKNIRGALSVVQFFFTCQNLSKIILLIILLTEMLMGKQNIWKSIVVKKKMKTQ